MEHELKLKKIRSAARFLRLSSAVLRNEVLKTLADLLISEQAHILKVNLKELELLPKNTAAAFIDRLKLTPARIQHMAESLREVAALPDPLSGVDDEEKENKNFKLKNGLTLKKVRSPLGVIFMIFESRPNVAIEAFSMGFKSGNIMILRGGSESKKTVALLYSLIKKSLVRSGFSADVIWGITDSDRRIVSYLLKQKKYIDVVVPRGGEALINYVIKNSLVPIIENGRGLCHIYVHSDADLEMAVKILTNAKTQRPSVCNSMETILVHRDVAKKLLPKVYEAMSVYQVKWFADKKTKKILKDKKMIHLATDKSWNTEYLDQIVNCKVVATIDEAIVHIEHYGSRHSECIVSSSKVAAKKFQNEVDAAVVYWNASTRFTDGYEFGLGGELGISTQKLHVRGPLGITALTSERWVVDGAGQIRE